MSASLRYIEEVAWLCIAALLLTGCSNPPDTRRDGSTLPDGITIRGRVVDAELCGLPTGCGAVRDVVVAWSGAPTTIRSELTGPDGAFLLEGVPAGTRSDLLVIPQGTAAASYAQTLNPGAVHPDDEDVFGRVLYTLPTDEESLLTAIETEAGVNLVSVGGFVGQVVRDEGGVINAVQGAGVQTAPEGTGVRYVNMLPRAGFAEPALRPVDAISTSVEGAFIVTPPPVLSLVTVAPGIVGEPFEPTAYQPRPGFVAYFVHASLR